MIAPSQLILRKSLLQKENVCMALWGDMVEGLGGSLVSNLLIGAAVVVLAPIVVPAVLVGMRPVAKTLVKGGVLVYDKGRAIVAEAGEQVSDLVAEARAEIAA
jgi:Protein of unknown function (DUF5132)